MSLHGDQFVYLFIMGIEVTSRSFEDKDNDKSISQLLEASKKLSGVELKQYFESMFRLMSANSKDVVTQIMWNSLNAREQHMFEMPMFGSSQQDDRVMINRLDQAFGTRIEISGNSN